ncbi:MAG: sortase [Clostridia bacterium]|nr:sortase [Clostridia bacterium]
MKKYRKIRIFLIITAISGMVYLLKDIYKEDNIRLEENTNKLIKNSNETKSEKNEENKIEAEDVENEIKIVGVDETKNVNTTKESSYNLDENYLGFEVIAKLEIPKIELDTYVLKEYSKEAMDICVTKLWGPNPNEIGNFCIIGHNYKKKNMFSKLINLEIGDNIFLQDQNNKIKEYVVYDIYKVEYDNIEPLNEETLGRREVTLITCVNYTNNRLVIKARELL